MRSMDTPMSVLEYRDQSISLAAAGDAAETTYAMFATERDPMPAGSRFEEHAHPVDQIAWTASGSVELTVLGERWDLHSAHLAWIPAGIPHAMQFAEPTELVSLYLDPLYRPSEDWAEPRTLRVDALAVGLMLYLTEQTPPPARRSLCARLLRERIAELPLTREVVALPRDSRARAVASRLLLEPADDRPIDAWADELGISSKTLARAFVRGSGVTFRQWRVNARLHAATGLLADGVSVGETAERVGYVSVSSFIEAFKRRFGVTPARYGQQSTATPRS